MERFRAHCSSHYCLCRSTARHHHMAQATRKARWSTRRDYSLKLCIPCGKSNSTMSLEDRGSVLYLPRCPDLASGIYSEVWRPLRQTAITNSLLVNDASGFTLTLLWLIGLKRLLHIEPEKIPSLDMRKVHAIRLINNCGVNYPRATFSH